ncbi:hypothetical protein GCM10010399_43770 [Dactylosporangium fulvum]
MLLVAALLSAGLTACTADAPSGNRDATVPTPTWAPSLTASPAGTVTRTTGAPASVAVEVGGSRTAVALDTAVVVLDERGAELARIPVDQPARAVVALPGGGFRALAGATVLNLPPLAGASSPSTGAPSPASSSPAGSVPAPSAPASSAPASSAPGASASGPSSTGLSGGAWPGLARWTLPAAGSALAVPPKGDWTAVALPDRGDVIILSATGAVTRTIDAGGRPTAVAADDTRVAVVDASQSSLTVFDAANGAKQEAIRAGDGAVTVTADGTGRFVVVDARDGELLVFETGPLILRQRHPVAGSPFGAAYDPTRRTLWVAVTQRNEVVGYDLSGGTPREVGRHPSVRLPVAVSVDPPTGTVAVAGSAEGLVQRIGS